jgi:hypothetical protein
MYLEEFWWECVDWIQLVQDGGKRRARVNIVMNEGEDGCLLGCSAVQTTRRYNPEDSYLHTRRRENFKSHIVMNLWVP